VGISVLSGTFEIPGSPRDDRPAPKAGFRRLWGRVIVSPWVTRRAPVIGTQQKTLHAIFAKTSNSMPSPGETRASDTKSAPAPRSVAPLTPCPRHASEG